MNQSEANYKSEVFHSMLLENGWEARLVDHSKVPHNPDGPLVRIFDSNNHWVSNNYELVWVGRGKK